MSDTEINLGFISGVVSSDMDTRQGDWGESVEFTVRHFVRRFKDSMGNERTIEHEFRMQCQTRPKMTNPAFREVCSLAPGDWVHLKYQMDQAHYEKNGEQKTFDKRMVVELVEVQRGSSPSNSQTDSVSSNPDDEPELPF